MLLVTELDERVLRGELSSETVRAALARHDEIVATTVAAQGGQLCALAGHSFRASFSTAAQALAAAVAMQQALLAEPWGATSPLPVRVALHAEEDDASLPGLGGLAAVSRLLGAGAQGQILLSPAALQRLRGLIAPADMLHELPASPARDAGTLLAYLQVPAAAVPAAPLSAECSIARLPAQASSFVGRERELESLTALLTQPQPRLVTLTGPGGTGKTRLAREVAARLLPVFGHGVFFISLAALSDPTLLYSTINAALGLKETAGQLPGEALKAALRDRQLLLVLDNFEQLLPAAAQLPELLAAAACLKVLVTSRTLLRLQGEHQFAVAPLPLPELAHLSDAQTLAQQPAVALFLERARAVRPLLRLSQQQLRAVSEVCIRLDGLPLAIELAAARCRQLDPEMLLSQLSSRLTLLTSDAAGLPARQQSLRRAIEWSYELLDSQERALFARLAIFVGGCSLDAVSAVCEGLQATHLPAAALEQAAAVSGLGDMLHYGRLLAGLHEHSLLRQEQGLTPAGQPQPRFRMLETIREYALERLGQRGEWPQLRRSFAHYYLGLLERGLATSGQEQGWMQWLEQEYPNVRAALEWSMMAEEGLDVALRLGVGVAPYWDLGGHLSEGRQQMERLVVRARANSWAGVAAETRASALYLAGRLAFRQGDHSVARELMEQSLLIYRQLNDQTGTARVLTRLGSVMFALGNRTQARAVLQESLPLAEAAGDVTSCIYTLNTLGEIARSEDDLQQAEQFYLRALQLSQQIESAEQIGISMHNLGHALLLGGSYERADQLFREALDIFGRLGYKMDVILCLAGLGGVAATRAKAQAQAAAAEATMPAALRAARLLGAVAAQLQATGLSLEPADRAAYDQYVMLVRTLLNAAAFRQGWADGQALSLEAIVAYARQEQP